uniref:Neurotransmitter-gated ion-channel ligand-binding domain-containing protein n=1 Tax=Ditylenchus dipsaci TaxID=166011 RepID=A0A915DB93_9BILA
MLTSELGNENQAPVAEEIANRTYVQEQSALQMKIFKDYNRKIRPVRNQSRPIQTYLHIYVMHFSVDQMQQVITLNGHIYMTWTDEIAVWDPTLFNNVRTTMAKQWDLWQPDLRVANSVSGVNQYFDISKRSHASLTSLSPTATKVEIYPTFSMRIGCHFDYSDYPSDVQKCALRLYTTNVMSEVELMIYYALSPSVMLGWGKQAEKRHISDWELLSVTSNLSYYRNKKYGTDRPATGWEAQNTWTLILVWIELKRNANLFWVALALPSFVSSLLNLFSFLLPKPEHSILITVANFFLQSVFLRDAIKELPPVVEDTSPRIVQYDNALLLMTTITLALHLCSLKIAEKRQKIPTEYADRFKWLLKYISIGKDALESEEQYIDTMAVFRNVGVLIYIIVTLCLVIVIFVF